MTQPRLAKLTSFGRMYARRENAALEVPSITTIISQGSNNFQEWYAYMAANAVIEDVRLKNAKKSTLKIIAKDATNAATVYRDKAALRGDRLHNYFEQYSLAKIGKEHNKEKYLKILQENKEDNYAQQFELWFTKHKVQPLHTEITIWNRELGYAGTLDLIANINNRICVIDFKTKTTNYRGEIKPLSKDVVMQLIAGMKAEEYFNENTKKWEKWPYHKNNISLIAVSVAPTCYRTTTFRQESFPLYWKKFCILKKLWDINKEVSECSI